MAASRVISIACASGFWGDTPGATAQLLREPRLDYLVSDYLSETTLTLLAKGRAKDPESGFIPDFFSDVIVPHLATCRERGIKLVTNAGALNPLALRTRIERFAGEKGIAIRIACVLGDDLRGSLHQGDLKDDQGRAWPTERLLTANAYLGARAVSAALAQGADLVITGRIVDSALALGPLAHEFGWEYDRDFDRLAQGSLAGHLIECGAQACGGNFTDWKSIPHLENVGFPVLRARDDGSFELTKPPGTGGRIDARTVTEQLVYEIADPAAYALPDVTCDFSQVTIRELGPDRVEVRGARGRAPNGEYKVSATVQEGYKIAATGWYAGPDAQERAQAAGQAILERAGTFLETLRLPPYNESLCEALGGGDGALLRLSAAHSDPKALEILAKELAPAATGGPPGLCNLLGGRAQPTPRIRLLSVFVPRKQVPAFVELGGKRIEVPAGHVAPPLPAQAKAPLPPPAARASGRTVAVPLSRLALARSGDKGDSVNLGVIARSPQAYDWLRAELTADRVAAVFSADFAPNPARTQRWELPTLGAFNFLLSGCLGGGGSFSLRIDPQGKAFGQRLLALELAVPEELLQEGAAK